MIGLVVPVLSNFKGFTELLQTVDLPVIPFVHNNWDCNVGVSVAWNIQINRAISFGCDYIIVANDDTILFPGTMQKMIELLDEGYDVVSPINTRDVELLKERRLADGADFAMFGITPETVNRYGLFDENIHSYFNDNDYTHRVNMGGGTTVTMLDVGFYHHGSVTQFKGGSPETEDRVVSHEAFRATERYYLNKWGGPVRNEIFSRPFNDPNKTIKDW